MSTHHDAQLVTGALEAAVATRGRTRMPATSFHSDRGSGYTSAACIDACQRLGLRRSMGRTGSCLDNAVAEAWFASLKVELIDRAHYRTRAQARTAVFAWIAWYNRFRLHPKHRPQRLVERHSQARWLQPQPHRAQHTAGAHRSRRFAARPAPGAAAASTADAAPASGRSGRPPARATDPAPPPPTLGTRTAGSSPMRSSCCPPRK